MHQVICFGEILWDNFLTGKKPGGAPMNVALHLHKQGVESRLISSVGNDLNGRELKDFLQLGSAVDYIQQHDTLPTGIVNVTLDEKQQATYSIVKPVAWDEIQFSENLLSLVNDADALVFGSLASRNIISHQTLLKLLGACKLAIFDMNLRPPHFDTGILEGLIKRCAILKINEHELDFLEYHYSLTKATIETRLNQLSHLTKTPTIVLTLGDKGAIIFHEGRTYKHSGFSITVADTVGAGDAFLAAFIAGFLQKSPMHQTLIQACATGAFVASKQGANPDYNTEEIYAITKI